MRTLLEVAKRLGENGVLQIRPPSEPFTLASGRTSIYKFDCERMATPTLRMVVALMCVVYQQELEAADFFAGVPKGGTILAKAIAKRMNKPFVDVGKIVTSTGRTIFTLWGNQLKSGKGVLFEDVVSSGGSARMVDDLLMRHKLLITHTIALIDREQQGKKKLRGNGHCFDFLYTAYGLVAYFKLLGIIDDQQHALLMRVLPHS